MGNKMVSQKVLEDKKFKKTVAYIVRKTGLVECRVLLPQYLLHLERSPQVKSILA